MSSNHHPAASFQTSFRSTGRRLQEGRFGREDLRTLWDGAACRGTREGDGGNLRCFVKWFLPFFGSKYGGGRGPKFIQSPDLLDKMRRRRRLRTRRRRMMMMSSGMEWGAPMFQKCACVCVSQTGESPSQTDDNA